MVNESVEYLEKIKKLIANPITWILLLIIILVVAGKLAGMGITGAAVAEFDNYEHIININASSEEKEIRLHIVFDEYKPRICRDGVLVVTGSKIIGYRTENELHWNGTCLETDIVFDNIIYQLGINKTEETSIVNETGFEQPFYDEPIENVTVEVPVEDVPGEVPTPTEPTNVSGINETVINETSEPSPSINITVPQNDTLVTNQTVDANISEATNSTYNVTNTSGEWITGGAVTGSAVLSGELITGYATSYSIVYTVYYGKVEPLVTIEEKTIEVIFDEPNASAVGVTPGFSVPFPQDTTTVDPALQEGTGCIKQLSGSEFKFKADCARSKVYFEESMGAGGGVAYEIDGKRATWQLKKVEYGAKNKKDTISVVDHGKAPVRYSGTVASGNLTEFEILEENAVTVTIDNVTANESVVDIELNISEPIIEINNTLEEINKTELEILEANAVTVLPEDILVEGNETATEINATEEVNLTEVNATGAAYSEEIAIENLDFGAGVISGGAVTTTLWDDLEIDTNDNFEARAPVIYEIEDEKKLSYKKVFDGIDVEYSYQLTKLKEEIVIDETALPPPEIQPDTLDFVFTLDYDTDLKMVINRQEFKNGKVSTSGKIEFQDEKGTLFYFTPPYAYDAIGERVDLTYTVKKAGQNVFLEVSVPYDWVSDPARVYPIVVDPTMSSATYVVSGVIAGGGGKSESSGGGYNLTMTVGQPVVGTSSDSTYVVELGFFYSSFDTTGPVVSVPTFNVTQPSLYYSDIQVNATFTDDLGLDSCSISVSGATAAGPYSMVIYNTTVNYTAGTISGVITDTLNDGDHTVTITCIDSTSNTGQNSAVFTTNSAPTSAKPLLNATNANNNTLQNLTAYNQSFSDADADALTAIYDWRLNGESIAVLNMPFDTENSTGTKDYSSFGNDGTMTGLNNATWKNNTICGLQGSGGCYEFDGSGEFISITNDNSLDFGTSTDFTLSAWVKTLESDGQTHIIVNKRQCTGNWPSYAITQSDSAMKFLIKEDGPDTHEFSSGDVSLNDGGWHYVVAVADRDSTVDLYVDGAYKTSQSITNIGNIDNSADLIIGEHEAGCGTSWVEFNGSIDQVQIYNLTLSADQIAAIYNAGVPRYDLIVSNETTKGQNWSVTVTPNDGWQDGLTKISNNLTVLNSPPEQATPTLTTSDITKNDTTVNLTVYNQSFADNDTDSLTAIYDWRLEGTSIAVLNMPFDTENSTGAKDYSSFSNDGTMTGSNNATWRNASQCLGGSNTTGGCYEFDGTNDFIRVGKPTSLDQGIESLTLAAWVKTSATGVHRIIGKWYSPYSYLLSMGDSSTAGQLRYVIRVGGVTKIVDSDVGGYHDGNWHYVVGTYNGSSMFLYVDGVKQSTETLASGTIDTGANLGIGEDGAGGYLWDGLIDQVQIFNRSLSAEQIATMYNAGSPNYTKIVSDETSLGNIWTAAVTPNDAEADGTTLTSNAVTITDSTAPTVILDNVTSVERDVVVNATEPIFVNETLEINVTVTDTESPVDSVWLVLWENIIGGAEFFRGLFSNIFGSFWGIQVSVNDSFTSSEYNYSIFANDTYNQTTQINDTLGVQHRPTSSSPIVNTTDLQTNSTTQNVTAWNQSFSDSDGDSLTAIYDWRVNGTSIALLNMPFDTENSTGAKDYSSFGNDGTMGSNSTNAPTWKNASQCLGGSNTTGGCYEFDGVQDDIRISNDASLNGMSQLTIGAWVKTGGSSSQQTIVSKNGPYIFSLLGGNVVRCRAYNGTWVSTTGASLTNNQWYHIAETYNGSEVQCWVNGAKSGTPVALTNNLIVSDATTYIGNGLAVGSPGPFNGSIDQVQIFNRSLSAEQIAAMYNSGTPQYNLIVEDETTQTDDWSVAVTPNDGWQDGITQVSSTVTINAIPTSATPILTASDDLLNRTLANLTAYNQSFADGDSEGLTAIYDWRVDGTSMAVLNMPFDTKEANSQTRDYSTFGNNGSIIGSDNATWKNASQCLGGSNTTGGCYEFDGTNDFIDAGNATSLNDLSETTWSAWVYWKNDDSQDMWMSKSVYKWTYVHTDRTIYADFAAPTHARSESTETVSLNQWHHVALTYDDNGDRKIDIYLDGFEVNYDVQTAAVGTLTLDAAQNLIVGGYGVAGYRFNGLIDQVQVHNRTLSAEQIQAIYNAGTPRYDLIVSNETAKDENWTVAITPSDSDDDGITRISNLVTIENTHPESTTPILNSTNLANNNTHQNLTVYNQSFRDNDTDTLTAIYDWRLEGQSIAVLNMPFDTNNATNATDYSSYANHGTMTGANATWRNSSQCASGGCYDFDGSGDYIDVGNDSTLNRGSGDYSIETWIRYEGTASTYHYIITKGEVGQVGDKNYGISLSDDETIWGIMDDDTTVKFTPKSPAVNDGSWHHIVSVRDGNNFRLYYDGSEQGTATDITGYGNLDHTSPLTIGIAYNLGAPFTGHYFDGQIDGIKIYNRSLSTEQILAMYNAGTPQHNLLVSNETNTGENWSVAVTPNDGDADGTTRTTNVVQIQDAPNITLENITSINRSVIVNDTERIFVNETATFEFTITDIVGGVSNVMLTIWETIKGGVILFQNFFTNIGGDLWQINVSVNDSFTATTYNYTVTANDTANQSAEYEGNFTVNHRPTSSSPIVNTTDPQTNSTTQNVTAWNQSFSDSDGDALTAIYDWRVNGTSIAVLNMPFDTENSTGAKDYSMFENDGVVINGTAWRNSTHCVSGGCYEFDGVDDFISLPSTDIIGTDTSFTIISWIQLKDNTTPQSIYGEYVSSAAETRNYFGVSNGKVFFDQYPLTGGPLEGVTSLLEDVWYQVAYVQEGSNWWAYINGQLDNSSTDAETYSGGTPNKAVIGARAYDSEPGGFYRYFDGSIDQLQIFNRSLSADQIASMYNAGTPRHNIIVDEETTQTDDWSVAVTPNDGWQDGITYISENVTINAIPTSSTPILNSTDPTKNDTTQNLTAYNQSFADGDSEGLTAIYDWRINDVSMAVLNMPFDTKEATQDGVIDYSTFGNNGTLNGGTTWKNASQCLGGGNTTGGCYEFDGDNDYIEMTNEADFDFTNKLTVSAWIKYMSSNDGNAIISKMSGIDNQKPFSFVITTSEVILLAMNGGGSPVSPTGTTPLNNGAWHYIVGTYNGSIASVYVDGILEDQDAFSNNLDTNDVNVLMGARPNGPTSFFNGSIDQVQIFNRSLSAEQIQAIYNAGSPRYDLIVSNETAKDENWTVAITPSDSDDDGITRISNIVTIENTKPESATPILNSTNPANNNTYQNLTVYNQSFRDNDTDALTAIYDWRLEGESIAVLNMPFDGGSLDGNTTGVPNGAKDYSSFSNNGTVVNATWKNSTVCGLQGSGGCYDFDGIGDYIDAGGYTSLDISGALTLSFWMYARGSSSDAGLAGTGITNYQCTYHSNGKVYCYINTGGNYVSAPVSLNTWHHITYAWDGTTNANSIKLYINGTLQDQKTSSQSSISGWGNFKIGIASTLFDGLLDQIQVFNRSLSAEQIAAIYNSGVPDYTKIVSNETIKGENWSVAVTPNDGDSDGITYISSNVTILNSNPTSATPTLTTSDTTKNDTTVNLTVYNQSFSDGDTDALTAIYDWRVNGTSMAVLNMPFDTENSTGAKDYSSFGNDGTLSGDTTWKNESQCVSGGCYAFDGVTDYVAHDPIIYNSDQPWTTTHWLNWKGMGADPANVFYSGYVASGSGLLLTLTSNNRFAFRNASSTYSYFASDSSNPYYQTGWFQLAWVADGIGNLSLYVDGSFVETISAKTAMRFNVWGKGYSGSSYDYNGSIDQVQIFNRSLSPEQIAAMYNAGSPNYTKIVSNETSLGNIWTAAVTPNDAEADGTTKVSNAVTITDATAPTVTVDNVTSVERDVVVNDTEPVFVNETLEINVTVSDTESPVDSVWLVIWENIIGGAEFVRGLFSNIFGSFWGIQVSVNDAFTSSEYNYSIYANDSYNQTTQINDTLGVQHRPTSAKSILNATDDPLNRTTANLTVYNQSFNDIDADALTAIYDWRLNGESIAVLNMPFDTENSTGAKDYSIFGNDGLMTNTPNNATWQNASQCLGGSNTTGGCYEFDGVDDKIKVDHSASLVITEEITLSAWFKKTSASNEFIISKYPNEATASYELYVSDVGRFRVYNSSTGVSANTINLANDGDWHHLAGTYNGSTLTVYLDGVSESTQTLIGPIQSGANSVSIGGRGNNDLYFDGSIDQVQIFNRSLSADQIAAMYNAGTPRYNLLVSNETTKGQNWSVAVTPNDGLQDGITQISNNLTVLNSPPEHLTPILNSTNPIENDTFQNLTVYNQSFADGDTDALTAIYDWRVNGTSFAVLNMPFDTENSTGAKDYSSFGNDGTITGTEWKNASQCVNGGCYEFDGVNDYVTIGSQLYELSGGTVSLWFKKTGDGLGSDVIIGSWGGSGNQRSPTLYAPSSTLQWEFGNLTGQDSGVTVNLDQWYHAALTYDSSFNIKIYLNGSEVDFNMSADPGDFANTVLIAKYFGSGSNYFNGSIDQVQIFNRSLSAEQIAAMYNAGTPRYDLLVSNETAAGENWSVAVTPNDEEQDGITKISNNVTITTFKSIAIGISQVLSGGINWTVDNLSKTDDFNSTGNNNEGLSDFNVSIASEGTTVDVYLRASGNLTRGGGIEDITLDNQKFTNSTTDRSIVGGIKNSLTKVFTDNKIAESLSSGADIFLKFFLSVPGSTGAGSYANNVTIKAIEEGEDPS